MEFSLGKLKFSCPKKPLKKAKMPVDREVEKMIKAKYLADSNVIPIFQSFPRKDLLSYESKPILITFRCMK